MGWVGVVGWGLTDTLFKDTTIIEVRPTQGTFSSTLDPIMFKATQIEEWIEQGYQDSKEILADSFDALLGVEERIKSEQEAEKSVNRLQKRSFKLE